MSQFMASPFMPSSELETKDLNLTSPSLGPSLNSLPNPVMFSFRDKAPSLISSLIQALVSLSSGPL